MSDEQIAEIQKALFFELGHKVDVYHSEKLREVNVVKHGDLLKRENIIRSYKY